MSSSIHLPSFIGGPRRRKGSQGSNSSKSGRPYFIATVAATKWKLSDGHGFVSSLDRDRTSSKSFSAGDEMAAPMSSSFSGTLPKTASDSTGDHRAADASPPSAEKEHKPPARTMTQPEGTFTYTVDKDDTLTSIAARFETTPSELVKINRLASRFVCPGKVLFIPENVSEDTEKGAEKFSPTDAPKDQSKPGSLGSPTAIQGSPKPGHAERIKHLSSPEYRPNRTLTQEEERKLDQDCIESFLKIYGVRHITDGQGVVGGVLLVTPNAAIFEPDVMETLVAERGIEKYYVNAPFDRVASAALYRDIVHMKLKHSPMQATNLPAPNIYYPRQSPPLSRSQASQGSETYSSDGVVGGGPKRSESQQAVKGSVSDKTDLELSEGESEGCPSLGSGRSDSRVSNNEDRSEGSEVFADEKSEDPNLPGCKDEGFASAEESAKRQSREDGGHQLNGCETASRPSHIQADDVGVTGSDRNERHACADVLRDVEDQSGDLAGAKALRAIDELKELDDERDGGSRGGVTIPNGRVSQLEDGYSKKSDGSAESGRRRSPSGPSLMTPLPDSLWPMSSSAPTTDLEEAMIHDSRTRKHSIPDQQQQLLPEKSKLKMLKKFPHPRWNSEAVIGDPTKGFAKDILARHGGEDRIPRGREDHSRVQHQHANQQKNAFSKLLANATPHSFVDFSSGLFQSGGNDDKDKVEDISEFQRQVSYSLPSPVLTSLLPSGGKTFFGERRGSSPESIVIETANLHAGLGRRFSEDSSMVKGRLLPGSKDDIRIEFKSEITLEDKKELFQNIDEIVPVPARPCEDPPLYLCLRMGRLMHAKITGFATGMKRTRKMKSEYWFSIPKDRVDELYHFIEHWAPGAYGTTESVDYKARDLELISSDELSDDDSEGVKLREKDSALMSSLGAMVANAKRTGNDSLPDWEDVPEPEHDMSLELELPLPELIGQTEILTEEHRRTLFKILPARAEGYSWSLIFSASQHGFSLQSMYRWMAKYESPVLLVIQDTENNVFGAMLSCTLKVSDHFYGTGESFLYTFYPEFKIYKWTGENAFFIKGNPESLAIGAGDGVFGLWLDGDLYHGRSHRCKTYDNATLSSSEDFCIKLLEAWGFVEFGDAAQRDSLC